MPDENSVTQKRTTHRNVWEQISAVSSLVLALVGLTALIFTWRQINEMREESRTQIATARAENQKQIDEMRSETQAQHLTSFIDKFDSPERLAIRKSLAEKRIDRKAQRLRRLDLESPPVEIDTELQFCDNIGLLTDRGYLDRRDVWITFGQWMFDLYADSRPYLDSLQDNPENYKECKRLVEWMSMMEKNEGNSTYDHPSEDDLYNSYLNAIEATPGQILVRRRTSRRP